MKRFSVQLLVALITFFIGISAVAVWLLRSGEPINTQPLKSEDIADVKLVSSKTSHDPCSFTRKGKMKLDALEAVQLAECFIAQNGYTDLPALEDKSKLTPESVYPGIDEHGMKMRHDSLERHAYGYAAGVKYSEGWAVVFRCKYKERYAEIMPDYDESLEKFGRVVTMDANGNRMRVEHQDFYLNYPGLVKLEH